MQTTILLYILLISAGTDSAEKHVQEQNTTKRNQSNPLFYFIEINTKHVHQIKAQLIHVRCMYACMSENMSAAAGQLLLASVI